MTNFEFFTQTHQALAELARVTKDPARRRHLEGLATECWNRRQVATRNESPVAFDLRRSGYVWISCPDDADKCTCHPHPGLQGLEDAWRIFQHGPSVRHVLTAADLVGDVARPANALRNRLAAAATWVEGHNHHLARVFRPPVLSVGNDGLISFDPAAGPRIRLSVFADVF